MKVIIKAILEKILEFSILSILYTNSKLVYNCLVKLKNIQEKPLMIDVISLY